MIRPTLGMCNCFIKQDSCHGKPSVRAGTFVFTINSFSGSHAVEQPSWVDLLHLRFVSLWRPASEVLDSGISMLSGSTASTRQKVT